MIPPTTLEDTTGKTTHSDLQIVDGSSSPALRKAPISDEEETTQQKPPQHL